MELDWEDDIMIVYENLAGIYSCNFYKHSELYLKVIRI